MKKLLLLLVLFTSFAACSNDDKEDETNPKYEVVTPQALVGEWMNISNPYSYYLRFFADTTGLYMKSKGTTTVIESINFKYKINGLGIRYVTDDLVPLIDSCGIAFYEGNLIFKGKTFFRYKE